MSDTKENTEPTGLSEEDKKTLSQLTDAKKTSASEAEIALLKNENVELKYKLYVSHLYLKYKLDPKSQIGEDGSFKPADEE